jgi:hypothetical protein
MALTVSNASTTIREAYSPSFEKAVHRNDSFFGLFPPWEPPPGNPGPGDTAYRWKLNSAGNDSVEIFTEGQNQPAAGEQTFVNAAVSWTYFRGMLQFTGHAIDALGSHWIDHEEEESNLIIEDVVDLMTTSFMGSSNSGLEVSVDQTAAYAGITRNGAAGYFEATETTVGGNLTWQDLRDLQETVRDNDKSGRPSVWLCSFNQESNIYSLTGQPSIKQIGDADPSPNMIGRVMVGGLPVIPLPDFSNTVIMLLDMRPGKFRKVQIRPFSVKEMAPSGDSDVFQVSWGGAAPVNRMPKYDGKLQTVTA